MKKPNVKPALMMDLNPFSSVSESFHSLRANIDFSVAGQEKRVLTITSSERGEGKSTTAMNLALAYSRAGKRVMLVDSDFRNPTLHSVLGIHRRDGLSDYLGDQAGVIEVIKETAYANLDVITSGALAANSTELMSSENLQKLFDELRNMYDRVIVDAPPLLAVIDAQIISAASDGVILVVEYGKTPRTLVQKAVQTLEPIRTPLIGAVMNKANRKSIYAY